MYPTNRTKKTPTFVLWDPQPVRNFRETLDNLPWQVHLTIPGGNVPFFTTVFLFGNRFQIPAFDANVFHVSLRRLHSFFVLVPPDRYQCKCLPVPSSQPLLIIESSQADNRRFRHPLGNMHTTGKIRRRHLFCLRELCGFCLSPLRNPIPP